MSGGVNTVKLLERKKKSTSRRAPVIAHRGTQYAGGSANYIATFQRQGSKERLPLNIPRHLSQRRRRTSDWSLPSLLRPQRGRPAVPRQKKLLFTKPRPTGIVDARQHSNKGIRNFPDCRQLSRRQPWRRQTFPRRGRRRTRPIPSTSAMELGISPRIPFCCRTCRGSTLRLCNTMVSATGI